MERLRRALRGDDLPIGEAMHPIALAAVIVLVVNDWVLKPRYPGVVTGKLSDVAGLVFAPVMLSALIGLVRRAPITRARLVGCIAATGAVFALIKLVPAVAAAISVGRFRFVADPTDLLCLPALAIAWWIGADELRRVTHSTDADR